MAQMEWIKRLLGLQRAAMKASKDKRRRQSKTGVVKVFFKNSTLSCVGNTATAKKSANGARMTARKTDQDDPA
jgi:hypothetical protein